MNRAYNATCETMPEIPDGSIQTCVTSPPYYGLRDYDVPGQIGLDGSLGKYVARLVGVFREVRRTLRDDGTLWLNLGDSYATTPRGNPNSTSTSSLTNPAGHASSISRGGINKIDGTGLKSKDRVRLSQ